TCTRSGKHDEWRADLAATHVVRATDLIDELIKRRIGEAGVHHVDNWSQPVHRGAERRSEERGLRDRRIDDSGIAELAMQTTGGAHGPGPDVLAPHDDALVKAHLLGDRLPNRRTQAV